MPNADDFVSNLDPPLVVIDEELVSSFHFLRNYTLYHKQYQTIFTAPFSGDAYFMAAFDDFNDFWFTKIDEDGIAVEQKKLYDSWWQSCVFPFFNKYKHNLNAECASDSGHTVLVKAE